MKTEVLIKAEIRNDITSEENAVLDFLFNDMCEQELAVLPDHEFFNDEEWWAIGSVGSDSHIPWVVNNYDGEFVFSRSCVDNHDGKVEKFFDWFSEVVHKGFAGDDSPLCIGYKWNECFREPVLIYV
jgi:hypothetical protein